MLRAAVVCLIVLLNPCLVAVLAGRSPNNLELVKRTISDSSVRRVASRFVSDRDFAAQARLSTSTRNSVSIVLVDIGVRDVVDLSAVLDRDVPNWPRFLAKLKNANQHLSVDKFIYTHDVGDELIQRVTVARVPPEMYQKLMLARTLLEGIAADQNQLVTVMMMNDFGEKYVDVDMCDALQSACEVALYPLPNLKASPTSGSSTATKTVLDLVFLGPESSFLQGENGENLPVAAGPSENQQGDDVSEMSWHYFQATSEEEAASRSERMSALERAMSAAPRLEKFTGPTVTSVSKFASRRHFQSLASVQNFLKDRSAVNEGTNLARSLSALPPNILNPQTFVSALESLSLEKGWIMDQWTVEDLKKMGCGAFCAVCQGNEPHGNDRLVRLRLTPQPSMGNVTTTNSLFPRTGVTLSNVFGGGDGQPRSATLSTMATEARDNDFKRAVVLVGKGVTYDTGGINLKSANSMKTMKHDMSGSSVALGVFGALAQMKFHYPLECWLAIVENNNGPLAYRPDDVVTAVTGDTIEVVHSDAEGRMLLADVLALASRRVRIPSMHGITDVLSPKVVCDFATLTGTCVSSLSNRYIGAFSNKKELLPQLIQAGESSGERVWPFPCDDDFAEDLKSDIADTLQCRQPTEADHIYATSFLKRFVSPAVPWVHFDLASSHRPGGLGVVTSDYTGAGVRATVDFLTDSFLSTTQQ